MIAMEECYPMQRDLQVNANARFCALLGQRHQSPWRHASGSRAVAERDWGQFIVTGVRRVRPG